MPVKTELNFNSGALTANLILQFEMNKLERNVWWSTPCILADVLSLCIC